MRDIYIARPHMWRPADSTEEIRSVFDYFSADASEQTTRANIGSACIHVLNNGFSVVAVRAARRRHSWGERENVFQKIRSVAMMMMLVAKSARCCC